MSLLAQLIIFTLLLGIAYIIGNSILTAFSAINRRRVTAKTKRDLLSS